MPTKNIVPKNNDEGFIGTSSSKWRGINATSGSFTRVISDELKNQSNQDLLLAGSNITINHASGQYTISSTASGGSTSLSGLSDVTLTSEANGEFLKYDGENWVNSEISLASTDLTDNSELARLASPTFTGSPISTTPSANDNSTRIATTAYVQTEIANFSTTSALNDLTDVSLSGTISSGEFLKYDGANWVNSALSLASTDLTDTASIIRTTSTLNQISDVDYSTGSIDGYVLTYSESNNRWEAQQQTSSSSSRMSPTYVTTTTYSIQTPSTADEIEQVYLVNNTNNVEIKLPDAREANVDNIKINIKNINTGTVKIISFAVNSVHQEVDGVQRDSANGISLGQYDNYTLYCDNNEWFII